MSQNKRGAAQAAPLLFFNSNRNILQKMTVFATLFKELAGPLQSLRRNKSYGMTKLRKSDRTTHLAPKMHYYKVMKAKGKKITKSEGFSLVELLIVVAIILIIAAIAIPNLLRSRMAANQAAAVATLRNINNSQATYISTYSQSGYADTFVKLGPGVPAILRTPVWLMRLSVAQPSPAQKVDTSISLHQRPLPLRLLIIGQPQPQSLGPATDWKIIAA